MKRIVLLSILPQWADAILDGKKKWEYRRVPPKVEEGSKVLLYASGNRHEIVGEFVIDKILHEPLGLLIKRTLHETTHTDDDLYAYFKGLKIGSALKVKYPKRYDNPVSLKQIQNKVASFTPPQNFRYLEEDDPTLKQIFELLPMMASID